MDFVIIHSGDTHGFIGDDDGSLGFSTVEVLADQYEAKGYTALSSSFVVNRMMNLPDERILEDMGILRILLWHVYEHYDPLTEDLLGEDRYVKS